MYLYVVRSCQRGKYPSRLLSDNHLSKNPQQSDSPMCVLNNQMIPLENLCMQLGLLPTLIQFPKSYDRKLFFFMSMGSGWYAQWIQVGMENGEQYRCPVNAWIYHGCEFISQGQHCIIISLISGDVVSLPGLFDQSLRLLTSKAVFELFRSFGPWGTNGSALMSP